MLNNFCFITPCGTSFQTYCEDPFVSIRVKVTRNENFCFYRCYWNKKIRNNNTCGLFSVINSRASSQPLENCNSVAASGGFFAFPPLWMDLLKAVHCLRASLSCSTLRFNSDNRLSRLVGSPAFSSVFNKLWLSINLCWISLYLSESCRWWDAACTPWSAEKSDYTFPLHLRE